MNRVILMGRLTRDPDVRYTRGDHVMAIARYTLAVDRRGRGEDGNQTGSYVNKEGQKVYTTEIILDEQEFADSKSVPEQRPVEGNDIGDGFMEIPDGAEDEGLPFS